MVLPASDMLPPPDALQSDHETHYQFPDSDFLFIKKPKNLVKNESLQQERQISVDPISLQESPYPCLELPPPPPSHVITAPKVTRMPLPPPLLPAKTKFSISLPGSTTSSPRLSSLKKKWKNQGPPLSPLAIDPLSRQHSVALTRLAQLQEKHLRRSKSCGEGRATAPSDDFDPWSRKANGVEHGEAKTDEAMAKSNDEEFKCGALCLFLPGFGRGKPVRPRKEVEKQITNGSLSARDSRQLKKEMANVISRTVSLEKFECGSWTSSAIVMDIDEEGDSMNLFFDLPLELVRSSVNEADSPVAAAFVFDKDHHRKGVLKTGGASRARKSHEESSRRHVRFSASSPGSHPTSPTSCITPRLRKAREDFNAFLEAQSA